MTHEPSLDRFAGIRAGMLALLAGCTCSPVAEPEPRAPAPVAEPVPSPGVEGLPVGRFDTLEPGLELGVFRSEVPHPVGDGRIVVVRVDPAHFELRLLTATSQAKPWSRTLDQWAEEQGLVAAINPSMYHADGISVFFLQVGTHVNQTQWVADANNLLVAHPRQAIEPAWDVLDTTCGGSLEAAKEDYDVLVQSWRLLDCAGAPTWTVNEKIWSHAVYGVDRQGRMLLVHARTPWNTRTFTDILLALPLDVAHLMYGEGGPEASLYVGAGSRRLALMGSYETGFMESDDNDHLWPIPNVLGFVRRR